MATNTLPAILGGSRAVVAPRPHFTWPILERRDEEAVLDQLRTSISIYGRDGIIKVFEDAFATYLNTAPHREITHSFATNNGTNALYAAYFGCGIGPGDEVILPSYSFVATAVPLWRLGARAVFCDIVQNTGNIDVEDAEKRITAQTKGIVITHMWGQPAPMEDLLCLCQKYNLFLIEDCSHAHATLYKGKRAGTFGDVACFSLQGKKLLSAGEGGILVTSNRTIYERAVMIGESRQRLDSDLMDEQHRRFIDTGVGLKFRIHPLGARLAHEQLQRLGHWASQRTTQLKYLTDALTPTPFFSTPFCAMPLQSQEQRPLFAYECLCADSMSKKEVDIFIKAVQAEGVDIRKSYIKPLHTLPLFGEAEVIQAQNTLDETTGQSTNGEALFSASIARHEKTFHLPTFTLPESSDLIDQYAFAFKKVMGCFDEIKHLS